MPQKQGSLAAPDQAAELIEALYEKGWTDGLPVVPPSPAAVVAMLAAAGLKGSDVVGEIEVRHVRITADKVALNAVLAGCLPAYMPVVVSAVKALCHPTFGYHGPFTSTGGAALVLIVNGPAAPKLGINSQDNAFGPGVRANLTIGRALRLLMMNSLNTRTGKLDRSTLGNPGKIAFCFAENEQDSPWEPLHVERGFMPGQSTTTVFAAEGTIQIYNQLARTPEPLLLAMADAIANLGSTCIVGQQGAVLVFAGEHAGMLRKSGWSKKQVKQFVFEHARRSAADMKRTGRMPGAVAAGDENVWRRAMREPEDLLVVCAGGRAGSFSCCLMGWGSHSATHPVTTLIEGV